MDEWVCHEVARLREPTAGEVKDRHSAAIYGRLLDICGYERVVVDVLAGTSAGGLNGPCSPAPWSSACRLTTGSAISGCGLGTWSPLRGNPRSECRRHSCSETVASTSG